MKSKTLLILLVLFLGFVWGIQSLSAFLANPSPEDASVFYLESEDFRKMPLRTQIQYLNAMPEKQKYQFLMLYLRGRKLSLEPNAEAEFANNFALKVTDRSSSHSSNYTIEFAEDSILLHPQNAVLKQSVITWRNPVFGEGYSETRPMDFSLQFHSSDRQKPVVELFNETL